ncbi:MAG: flagellar basal body-associated FliL family protein [Chloroflexi bacterium]|nr:flagellar basal body-associated FliL family protein [Chloroflexota bacterium]
MERLNGILKMVSRILLVVILAITTLFSLATAYIIFAPDSLPKPFYLQYLYPTPVPTDAVTGEAVAPTEEPAPVVLPGQGIMINSGSKIINLADQGGRKYIRVSVVLEFAPDPTYAKMSEEEKAAYTTQFNTEINDKMPLIDDAIITLLSTKTFDTMYTAEGKEQLRQELLLSINRRLTEYNMIAVYFTEFVVE